MARLHTLKPHSTSEEELLSDFVAGESDDSKIVSREYQESLKHFMQPMSRRWEDPQTRFLTLKSEWTEATRFLSSVNEICMHPSYQSIIGMGEVALPFILSDLRRKPAHWFWALKSITGVDPVKPEHRGDLQAMTDAWIFWGGDEGFIKT